MAQTENLTGTIAAFFENSNNARKAVEALHDNGFSSAHIGVAHRGGYGSTASGSTSSRTSGTAHNVKEHAFTTWDKVKNWFSGDQPEPYENERRGDAISGREVVDPDYDSGYASSDLHGSFRNLEIPEEQSRYFTHLLSRSPDGAVVTVNAGARRAEAEDILIQYGGDLGTGASSYDYSDTEANRLTSAGGTSATTAEEYEDETSSTDRSRYREENPDRIQLLGEVLRVHKDRVSRGEVRIRKEVVTDTQTVQVPVTREELVVERRPVNELKAAPTADIGEEEIRVPLTEERATFDKDTVVREEVSVGKRPVEEVRDVTGEVRREELVVDDEATRKDDPNRRVA